jgi:cobalt/nickel transport system permease protein
VVFVALLFQSLIFQHGGILSAGLNALNMGAGAIAAYLLWRVSGIPEFVRAFTAGFLGIMVPALFMAVEFNVSGYGRGIFYLLYVYIIVAVIEGLLTLTIVKFFRRVESPILS